MRNQLRFNLNGRSVEVSEADPETSLASYLRNVERLTGTKIACGEGYCGACTVVLGRWEGDKATYAAVNACVTPLFSVDGLFVITVEGIGSTKRLHAIQERLSEGHGTQCGFCSPGFVMSAYALLRNNPNPTKKEILKAVRGNLCRCTGYRPILDALYSFADGCCQGKGGGCPCKEGAKKEQKLVDLCTFPAIDSSQELIFPPELLTTASSESLYLKDPRVHLYIPQTEAELKNLLQEHPEASVISSGMITRLKNVDAPTLKPTTWISVSHCFKRISIDSDSLSIGSSLSIGQLLSAINTHCHSSVSTPFNRLFDQFSSTQIMNLASWSGSLGSASDFLAIARAMRLKLEILREDKKEMVDVNDFVEKREEGSVVMGVKIPLREEGVIWVQKVGERRGPDIGVVTVAAVAKSTTRRIVMGLLGFSLVAERLASLEMNASREQRILALDEDLSTVESQLGKEYSFVRDVARGVVSRLWEVEEGIKEEEGETEQIYEGTDGGGALGKPIRHDFAPFSVTGEAVFVGDVPSTDAVHLGYVLSEEAHAEFTVDASEALKIPGVVGYYDYANVTGNNRPGTELFNALYDDTPFFAEKGVVEYHSQLIGVVAAKDAQTATRAAKLVKVFYKRLPAILTIEEAIAAESYLGPHEVCGAKEEKVEEALKNSEKVVEGEMYIGGQEHMYMEPQSALVTPGEGGFLTILASTQSQSVMQHQAAALIGIPAHQIVVKTKRLGGAFGGKCTQSILPAVVPALVAHQLGKPVWSIFSRKVDCHLTGKRHPFLVRYRAGFQSNGRLTAIHTRMFLDGGYSVDHSQAISIVAACYSDVGCHVPVMRSEARAMKTNKCSQTAFRGFGSPQACIATETILQHVAVATSLPLDVVKEINMSRPGGKLLMGAPIKNESMVKCWEEVKEMAGLEKMRKEVDEFNRNSKEVKRGIGTKAIRYGLTHDLIQEQAAALVQIYMDGSVAISIGGIEMGQGLGIKCRQVCSRTLEIPLEKVMLLETGTDKTANSPETGGSQGTDLHGMAVKKACDKLMEGLTPLRTEGKTWNEMIWEAHVKKLPLQATEHIRVDRKALGIKPHMPTYFTCGAAIVMVELDCITGEHMLKSVDIVMDVGKSINPAIDIGQVEGAFMQGYGLVTCEQMRWDEEGRVESAGFGKYKIPTTAMCPKNFRVKLMDKSEEHSPSQLYSSKGIGEPPLLLGVASHAALHDALLSFGVTKSPLNSPLSRREILQLLREI